jgi:hypothetical protein
VFATKGAAPGEILHELVLKAITALSVHGAIVKSLVCDGAQPNKKLATLLGVSGESLLDSSCSFPLPTNDVSLDASVTETEFGFEHTLSGEKVYFFFDVPHLLKCVRNYIFSKPVVQVCYHIYDIHTRNIL